MAWRQSLPPLDELSEDDRELMLNFERIYERWEQKTLARGRREGEAKATAQAVLEVLDARGLHVTAAQRKQVLACTDPKQLGAWLRGAAVTPTAAELLAAPAPRRRVLGRSQPRRP